MVLVVGWRLWHQGTDSQRSARQLWLGDSYADLGFDAIQGTGTEGVRQGPLTRWASTLGGILALREFFYEHNGIPRITWNGKDKGRRHHCRGIHVHLEEGRAITTSCFGL